MVKHRRFSNNQKPESVKIDEKIEPLEENIISTKSTDVKSKILSATKYIYIIIIAALFSGIFTPLTLGVEIENVIFGILSLFLGCAGGIIIFLGIKYQKFTVIMVCAGLGMMFASLILIHEIALRSLF